MAFVMIAGLLLLAVAIALLFTVATRPGRTGATTPQEPAGTTAGPTAGPAQVKSDAERELEMRFARGEIDADALIRGRAALRDG
jgi:hypothetical protein